MAYLKSAGNRVAIYVRVSTLHQIDKDSLPMQKQDLIAYAKLMLNTDDFVIFEDAGYSGKNTDRPKFQEMMTQIRAGLFSHLLVWKIDRISRNLLDFATMYEELKSLGVTFVSKSEQFQTDTAMGEAMLKIILVFAELERNMTSERVTATMISRAGNGLWNGGRVPYGYTWNSEDEEFSFNNDEYNIVRMIYNKYEEFRSLVVEARWMNEHGYRTRSGALWSANGLQIILRNPFYCGDYLYNVRKDGGNGPIATKPEEEWVLVKDHHPAIVSREQKERIAAILESNTRMYKERSTSAGAKNTHIFSGLVFCGICEKAMYATIGKKKDWSYSKYSCSTRWKSTKLCSAKSTSDPVVGEFVFNYILNMLNAQRDFDTINSPEELQAKLLTGGTFHHIDHIDSEGLNDLYNVLLTGKVKGDIYGKGAKIKTAKKEAVSELAALRKEKEKLERALDRLTKLYLYSEDAMSDSEYVIEKANITNAIDEIDEKIGFANSDDWNQSVSDEVFIQRASEFIISQKFTDRVYISYKALAMSVDAEVIKTFVFSIIDSIIMDGSHIKQIIFKNGLSHKFIFKDDKA